VIFGVRKLNLYAANQFFKINTSEYFMCTPKYVILTLNNQKFSGEGAQPAPSPDLTPSGERPSTPPLGASILAPSALDVVPQT